MPVKLSTKLDDLMSVFTDASLDAPAYEDAAVRSCGNYNWCGGSGDPAVTKANLRKMIAEALMSYGHYDSDDGEFGPNYVPGVLTVQTQADGELAYDGWRANKRLAPGEDLFTYVVENHLQD